MRSPRGYGGRSGPVRFAERAYVGDRTTSDQAVKHDCVRGRRIRSVGMIDGSVDKRQVAWYLLV